MSIYCMDICVGENWDDDFFQLEFDLPMLCSENEAWKVAEKLLSYFPVGSTCDLYEKSTMIWYGQVMAKNADAFCVAGNFGERPIAELEPEPEGFYLEN